MRAAIAWLGLGALWAEDADKEANWLPSPPSGPINVTMRIYWPEKAVLDGTYKIPPLRRVP